MKRLNTILELVEAETARYRSGLRSLLDLGCADGEITHATAIELEINDACGVDISVENCKRACQNGIQAYCLDLNQNKLPWADNSFDLVLMLEVIEHLSNPDFAIKEVRRVISENGIFVLSTPNMASYINRILLIFGFPILGLDISTEYRYHYPFNVTGTLSGHIHLYTLGSIEQLLAYNGFAIRNKKGIRVSWLKTSEWGVLDFLDRFLATIPSLATSFMVLARPV